MIGKYKYIRCPEHPLATKVGYVLESRLNVEKSIGRYLNKEESVHHIDGNPDNNDISNLFLTTKSGNSKAHSSLLKIAEELLKRKFVKFNRIKGIYEIN